MSGFFGYFELNGVGELAELIEGSIDNNEADERDFSPETLARFNEAAALLRRAALMAHKIDMLMEGDYSEETFNEEWIAAFGSRPL